MEAELAEVTGVWRQFEALQKTLAAIGDLCLDRAGPGAVRFEKLTQAIERILALFDAIITRRDPDAARLLRKEGLERPLAVDPPAPAHTVTLLPANVASADDAAQALEVVSRYLSGFEPSSPALLLVRQAQQLMGKSLPEVMRILLPDAFGQAAIRIGKEQVFRLPIERLSLLESGQTPCVNGPTKEHGTSIEQLPSARDYKVNTRQDAIGLLGQIGAYYRVAEPTSPVAFIVDRARELAGRDFLSLLKELLPDST
jgi:type VI secretion system protein ImpA